jgi:hypothetical protein
MASSGEAAGARVQSRYKGVSWNGACCKWVVVVWDREIKRARHVGSYCDELAAARAYDREALRMLGRDAGVNFEESGWLRGWGSGAGALGLVALGLGLAGCWRPGAQPACFEHALDPRRPRGVHRRARGRRRRHRQQGLQQVGAHLAHPWAHIASRSNWPAGWRWRCCARWAYRPASAPPRPGAGSAA